MIALYKLEKLPRNQRLRKIASVLAHAERNLEQKNTSYDSSEADCAKLNYFYDIAKFLSRDAQFSKAVLELFNNAAELFQLAASSSAAGSTIVPADNTAAVRRSLNSIRHLLLAETGRSQADWDLIDNDGHLDSAQRQIFPGMQVYLEDIRSPFNVGAMFRCAESFGTEKIFLSQFCADPLHPRAQRTAMGCIDVIPWERRDFFNSNSRDNSDFSQNITHNNSKHSFPIFAMETGGIPLADFPFPKQGLLIAGSEELGVSPQALAAADASLGRVSIPSYGAKASLNVSVAFGIVMQAWAQAIKKI